MGWAERASGDNGAILHSEMAFLPDSYWIDIHSNIRHHLVIATRDGKAFRFLEALQRISTSIVTIRGVILARIPQGIEFSIISSKEHSFVFSL